MARDVQISVRIETEVREALERAAKADNRTMAQYLHLLIVADLRAKGLLPKPKK